MKENEQELIRRLIAQQTRPQGGGLSADEKAILDELTEKVHSVDEKVIESHVIHALAWRCVACNAQCLMPIMSVLSMPITYVCDDPACRRCYTVDMLAEKVVDQGVTHQEVEEA